MTISKNYVVKKDGKKTKISYVEKNQNNGFSIKPKSFNTKEMISVDKMVIISPSLIEKLIDKKCQKSLIKILKMIALIYEEDDNDDGSKLGFILDEIEKFKELLLSKYKDYMEVKDYKLLMKKLEILESEVKLRKISIEQKIKNKLHKKNKGR